MSGLTKCPFPWTQVFVDVNKSLSPCCAPMELGSINDQKITDIYNGKQFKLLRHSLESDTPSLVSSHCVDCYSWNKVKQSGKSFDELYPVGSDTERTLLELEASHPDFVDNYRSVKNAFVGNLAPNTNLKPLRIEVQIGEHCDIDCIMCWQDHTKPRALRKKNLEEIYELLPYLLEITVTGGEPTIFPGFWGLIERFKQTHMPYARLQLLTHGQHLAENLEKFEGIPYLGFCVNVDGPNQALYERIRKGSSWKKLNASLSAVDRASSNHPGWGLNTTFLLMKSNIEHIDESIRFANQYNASWSCGLISGDYTPIERCTTFFAENIFRFNHLGYSREQITQLLAKSLPLAEHNDSLSGANTAAASLKASITEAVSTHQIEIASSKVKELLSLEDAAALSRELQAQINISKQKIAFGTESNARHEADELVKAGERAENCRDHDSATKRYKKAISIYNSLNLPSELIETNIKLGRCISFKTPSQAVELLSACLNQTRENFGDTHSRVATASLELGKALTNSKDHEAARTHLEGAYRTFSILYGKQEYSSYVAVSAYELAKLYLQKNDSRATTLLRKSVRMFESSLGRESSLTQQAAWLYHDNLIATSKATTAQQVAEHYALAPRTPFSQHYAIKIVSALKQRIKFLTARITNL